MTRKVPSREIIIESPLIDELTESETDVFVRTLQNHFGVHAVKKAIHYSTESAMTKPEVLDQPSLGFISGEDFTYFGRMMGHGDKVVDSAWGSLWSSSIKRFHYHRFPERKQADEEEIASLESAGFQVWDRKDRDGDFLWLETSLLRMPSGETVQVFKEHEGNLLLDVDVLKMILESGRSIPRAGIKSRALFEQIVNHRESLISQL